MSSNNAFISPCHLHVRAFAHIFHTTVLFFLAATRVATRIYCVGLACWILCSLQGWDAVPCFPSVHSFLGFVTTACLASTIIEKDPASSSLHAPNLIKTKSGTRLAVVGVDPYRGGRAEVAALRMQLTSPDHRLAAWSPDDIRGTESSPFPVF